MMNGTCGYDVHHANPKPFQQISCKIVFFSTVFLQNRVLLEISRLWGKQRETGKISRRVKSQMRNFRYDFREIPKSLDIKKIKF